MRPSAVYRLSVAHFKVKRWPAIRSAGRALAVAEVARFDHEDHRLGNVGRMAGDSLCGPETKTSVAPCPIPAGSSTIELSTRWLQGIDFVVGLDDRSSEHAVTACERAEAVDFRVTRGDGCGAFGVTHEQALDGVGDLIAYQFTHPQQAFAQCRELMFVLANGVL